MTTRNATAAVPAETDPSAESAVPAKRKGALPTVSGSGPGEWNDSLVAGIAHAARLQGNATTLSGTITS